MRRFNSFNELLIGTAPGGDDLLKGLGVLDLPIVVLRDYDRVSEDARSKRGSEKSGQVCGGFRITPYMPKFDDELRECPGHSKVSTVPSGAVESLRC